MLMATPDTIWLPRWLIDAKPWMSEKATDAAIPARRPIQAESDAYAAAAAAKAATSILPSSPISTTPERSDHKPARQAARSGIDSRSDESKMVTRSPRSMAQALATLDRRSILRHETPEQAVESAREQDDDAADHHHHVAGDGRLLEGKLRAALVEDAEQQRRQDDADRMRAPHEGHRDADEAVAGREFEQQAVLVAHEFVDREPARQRAGDDHRDDDDARRRDARIDRRRRIRADDADRIAEARPVDEEPDAVGRRRAPGRA